MMAQLDSEVPMIPLATFVELYDYNYWARDRQLEACAALSQEQFLRPLGSSFSSLRDTLAHVMGAEWIWLERWLGRSPQTLPGVPEGLAFAETLRRWQEQFATVAAIRDRWLGVERDLRQYLARLDETALGRELVYVNIQGQTWTYPLWRTILHLVNHGTYHRGQVTTLLRQLGAKAPEVDFLVAHDRGFQA
jgi:uncharacterized damage-inducible protein DinB